LTKTDDIFRAVMNLHRLASCEARAIVERGSRGSKAGGKMTSGEAARRKPGLFAAAPPVALAGRDEDRGFPDA
jgi:hypothetical protein